MVFRRRSPVDELQRYALMYPAKADASQALMQDFHSFRQALNVASADQRILVLVHAPANREPELRESLRSVANDARIQGRFHFDFERDGAWKEKIAGAPDGSAIVVINPGEFGLKGQSMRHLDLDAPTDEIINALIEANQKFAKTTKKKVYSSHVAKGRQQGIYFESVVPYGEDRDGDGEIDHRGGPRSGSQQSRGRRPGGPPSGLRPPR